MLLRHSLCAIIALSMITIMICGAQSARANSYVIAARDWRRHGKRLKGFEVWPR